MKYPIVSINIIMSLIKMFTDRQIEGNAKKNGFTKRNTGLTAITFFKAFTIGLWNVHEVTLDIIAGKCMEMQYGLKLTKQILFNRLKWKAYYNYINDYIVLKTKLLCFCFYRKTVKHG